MKATILLTLAIVGLAVLLLGVKVFFVRGGRFPNTHIHDNAEMRKRGITCARDKHQACIVCRCCTDGRIYVL